MVFTYGLLQEEMGATVGMHEVPTHAVEIQRATSNEDLQSTI